MRESDRVEKEEFIERIVWCEIRKAGRERKESDDRSEMREFESWDRFVGSELSWVRGRERSCDR